MPSWGDAALGFIAGGAIGGWATLYAAVRRPAIHERETTFTQLQIRRARVLEELYIHMVNAQRAFQNWIRPIKLPGETGEEAEHADLVSAAEKGNAFIDYYQQHRVFFDDDLCDLLDAVMNALINAHLDRTTYPPELRKTDPEARELWKQARKTINEEVPAIKARIEEEFQYLLGIRRRPRRWPWSRRKKSNGNKVQPPV